MLLLLLPPPATAVAVLDAVDYLSATTVFGGLRAARPLELGTYDTVPIVHNTPENIRANSNFSCTILFFIFLFFSSFP